MMKIVSHILLSFILLMSVCSACQTKDTGAGMNTEVDRDKVLIVYLTRTENTEAVAKMIHKEMGGKLVELALKTPYPKNYDAIVAQVDRENETGYLPPLKTTIDSIGQYDIVFVGFPTWDMQLPPPMKSFLHRYDLSDKTVIPFNTNAGYGVGSSFDKVKELCPNSKILEGCSTKGGVERDGIYFVMEGEKRKNVQAEIKKWLKRVKIRI